MSLRRRRPRVLHDVTYNLAEHEVLISFNTDDTAVAFLDWWHGEGFDVFSYYANYEKTGGARDEDDEAGGGRR